MLITIEPLAPVDLEAYAPVLADLLVDVVNGGTSMGFLPPLRHPPARDYWMSLERELRAGTRVLLVAYHDGRIVGSGQLDLSQWPNARHRAELQKLFVSKTMRGQGVGTLLMTALHAAARDRGRSLILLGTTRGAPSERFYRGLGYEEIGVIPGYTVGSAGERYDRVTFYRDLAPRVETT